MPSWHWDWIIAAAALLLSLYNFLVQLWAGRQAGLELRYEEVRIPLAFPTLTKESDTVYRLVLVNHGPHVARKVKIKVFRIDGQETNNVGGRMVPSDAKLGAALPDPLSIPAIYMHQEHHIPFVTGVDSRPATATLRWRDGRPRRQRRTVWLSAMRY